MVSSSLGFFVTESGIRVNTNIGRYEDVEVSSNIIEKNKVDPIQYKEH